MDKVPRKRIPGGLSAEFFSRFHRDFEDFDLCYQQTYKVLPFTTLNHDKGFSLQEGWGVTYKYNQVNKMGIIRSFLTRRDDLSAVVLLVQQVLRPDAAGVAFDFSSMTFEPEKEVIITDLYEFIGLHIVTGNCGILTQEQYRFYIRPDQSMFGTYYFRYWMHVRDDYFCALQYRTVPPPFKQYICPNVTDKAVPSMSEMWQQNMLAAKAMVRTLLKSGRTRVLSIATSQAMLNSVKDSLNDLNVNPTVTTVCSVIYQNWTHVIRQGQEPKAGGVRPLTLLSDFLFGCHDWFMSQDSNGHKRMVNASEFQLRLDFARGCVKFKVDVMGWSTQPAAGVEPQIIQTRIEEAETSTVGGHGAEAGPGAGVATDEHNLVTFEGCCAFDQTQPVRLILLPERVELHTFPAVNVNDTLSELRDFELLVARTSGQIRDLPLSFIFVDMDGMPIMDETMKIPAVVYITQTGTPSGCDEL